MELQFVLLDPRPNLHSFTEYAKQYKITKIIGEDFVNFVNYPTNIIDKNATRLSFD